MADRHCTCAHCGAEFVTVHRSKIYCSRRCNFLAFRARSPDRVEEYRDREKEKERASRESFSPVVMNKCATCGRSFYWKKKKARCSKECELLDGRKRYKQACVSSKVNETRSCVGCGKQFVSKTDAQIYCSNRCCKPPSNARKRAKLFGVEYEPVKPANVFERDGWRCQICGKQTPKARRGSRYSNAPELDHRIPISKGGPHTYGNTQCACRACNSEKSNRSNTGQIALFSESMAGAVNKSKSTLIGNRPLMSSHTPAK